MHPLLIYGIAGWVYEFAEREAVFIRAQAKANELGKPLLNAGCGGFKFIGAFPRGILESDVNLDVQPRDVPRFTLASVEEIPFPDKHFGAAFCSHVLEHTADWRKALAELHRVADHVYIIVPKAIWLGNWLNPQHQRFFVGDKVYERTDNGWQISDA